MYCEKEDSENVKYEKWKAEQEAMERERILEQNEQIYDNLLRAIKYSDNPEEYSLNNLNYQRLRNGRTREKLEIAQRERCQVGERNQKYIEIFEESNGSTSKTRNIQAEVFKHKGVKVHFKNFEDENKREEDIQNLIEENNEEIVEIIKSCENCQKVYMSKDLDQINKKIDMDEIENLRKKLRNIEEKLRKTERDNDSKEVQSIKDEINKIEKTLLNSIGERIAELLKRISDCKIM
ncbi:7878_t:CDS:2 [Dentiscutata heterogama]|uniref:7878_t:CDS:1 n=1 Tax=Dentiscutata heterogama TaxID=1316150 RepID=A0ACA9KZW6_9GLOM|nr:7878_t:CDS:2 [Dentiscutata heterogama]